jgi:hypothetical protein
MNAITREEKIMSGENLTPITRKEMFLAKAAGQNVTTPEPITREEMFLSNIQGGSGGDDWIVGDGKTRFHINIPTDARMDISVKYGQTKADGVKIDWGDGSGVETDSGSNTTIQKTHDYPKPGNYIVTFDVDDGCQLSFPRYTFADGTNTNISRDNSLKKIDLGGNVALSSSCFSSCRGLTDVNLPINLTTIPNNAFTSCIALREINLPENIAYIGESAFSDCVNITKVKIPYGVTQIKQSAFNNCNALVNLDIPYGVTSIKNYAFSNCGLIDKISVPSSVTSIGMRAFSYCDSLLCCDLSNHTSIPTLNTNVFQSPNANLKINVPAALVDEWKAATNWAEYADYIVGV